MADSEKQFEKEVHLNIKELAQLFELNELRSLRYEFFEKIALLIIAALGLITALAWQEALKITFQEIFSELSPAGERFLYPVVITIFTVLISILIGKLFLRKAKNIK